MGVPSGSVYNWWSMGGLASVTRLSRGSWVSVTRILLHINQPVRTNRKNHQYEPARGISWGYLVGSVYNWWPMGAISGIVGVRDPNFVAY